MSNEGLIQAIREHDWSVRDRAAQASPTLVAEIERAMPTFDTESGLLAVISLIVYNGPGVGAALLALTHNQHPQVAAEAARGLGKVKDRPPIATILAAIPSRTDPLIRGELYLVAGSAGDARQLDLLRKAAAGESDEEAAAQAQIAAVKLGGLPEREAFMRRIREAVPAQATRVLEQMRYVGDRTLAKALLPWLSNTASVTRLGTDAAGRSARMCDVALWTAHLLGVRFEPQPTKLDNYPPGMIAAAAAALRELPGG